MPSAREKELARVINRSWQPLEQWSDSDRLKMAFASAHDPMTGTQSRIDFERWLSTLNGVKAPLQSEILSELKNTSMKVRPVEARLSFNVLDEVSQRYAASQAGLLVKSIADGQRQTIQQIINRAVSGELTVDTAARHLRGSIGLHPAWAKAVADFGDRTYGRLLDDGMDRNKAAQKALDLQERYRQKLVRTRSRNIARTEIATANNVGQYAAYESAVGDGYAHPQALKEWAPGPGACKICGPMSGEKVQWDQEFSNGRMMPPGHPGCRCSTNLLDPSRNYRPIDHTNPKGDRLTPENMATQKPTPPPAPAKKPAAKKPKKPVDNELSEDMKLNPGRQMQDYQTAMKKAGYDPERFHTTLYDGAPRPLRVGEMPVKQGAPLSMDEARANVNPNFGDAGHSRNCTMCTTSYEMRRRGFKVQAGEGTGRPDQSYISSWWTDKDGMAATMTSHPGKNDFKAWMNEQPPGARGAVAVNWKRGGGHVWNWEVDEKGVVHYIETQANGQQTVTTSYKEWSKEVTPTGIRTVRLDDKVPNQYVLEAVTDKQPYTSADMTPAGVEQLRRYNLGMNHHPEDRVVPPTPVKRRNMIG